MTLPSLILSAPRWWSVAAALMAVASVLIVWSYARARTKATVRLACVALKTLAVASLALILLEPLLISSRPRRGANAFAVLADNSQSLLIHDDNAAQLRGDWVREHLRQGSSWQTRLGQDFDVRDYVFDSHLRSTENFDSLAFDGTGPRSGLRSRPSRSGSAACPWPAFSCSATATARTWKISTGRRCRRSTRSCPLRKGSSAMSASGKSRSARRTSSRPRL